MNSIDAVVPADPDELKAANLDQWCYSGNYRPPGPWFDECRARGVAPRVMIHETYSQRSQAGFAAGAADCRWHEARVREVGHDGLNAVVVSDGSKYDAWDASEYGRGWASAATMGFFPYGSVPICASFIDGASTPGSLVIAETWVPATWGDGTFASQRVYEQAEGISTSHDLNYVYHDFGAAPSAPRPNEQEPDMWSAIIVGLDGLVHSYAVAGATILYEDDPAGPRDPRFGIPLAAIARGHCERLDLVPSIDGQGSAWDRLLRASAASTA